MVSPNTISMTVTIRISIQWCKIVVGSIFSSYIYHYIDLQCIFSYIQNYQINSCYSMIKTQHFYLYIQGCHGGYFPQKIWVKIRSCFDRKRHIDCALKAGFSGYYLYMCAYLKISVKSQVNLYVISFEKIDKLLCFAHFNFIWRTIIAIIATTGIIIEFKRTLKGCAILAPVNLHQLATPW